MMKEEELPVPFLFNPLKHHLGVLYDILSHTGFEALFPLLLKLGSSQMDMYTGKLPPRAIFKEIASFLGENGITDRTVYREYLASRGDYIPVTLSDHAVWTLRFAAGERFVHVHPGRHVPHTRRIKATALKTALLYEAAKRDGRLSGDQLADINRLREMIGLSPIRSLKECRHLLELVDLLETT
ncbi:hypothetical protein SAMN05660909_00146 [Chitinophaga terrae (ex Kim and Jung 2007)]|uniref:Uncharacterized protein n=1 Tax=Chitinophaga terrae (ex Kim and Jung 2007) TaxID=408074 RepID=A0A1H3WZY4_9BACT|nr:hypothetical protein [Chitinophaga terrae (ex Kim and Jung 2007)]GEP90246.1 hypothetical protein CTE07_18910 [Chitinophaga terrae (ex Kim and Jung 2007)]SDZ91984.1 hypothetical protein SAMN05660909_00146 [Chitinophaga terrae (ex Kim and Jung 2007)]